MKEAFGKTGRVAIKGTINGFPFRSTLTAEGEGKFYLMINQQMREGGKAEAGDLCSFVMEPDTEPRSVEVPADLQAALAKKPAAAKDFATFSYSHKKEFVDWITSAKRPETRADRVEKTIAMILAKERRP